MASVAMVVDHVLCRWEVQYSWRTVDVGYNTIVNLHVMPTAGSISRGLRGKQSDISAWLLLLFHL